MSTPVDLQMIGGQRTTPPSDPDTTPFDPSRAREKAREDIAKRLLWCLIGVVAVVTVVAAALALPCYFDTARCQAAVPALDAMTKLLALVFTPLVGLVGAATGFYFGEKSTR